MIYLETGFFSWNENYGFGRYFNELIKCNKYDCVICFQANCSSVPISSSQKVIGLDEKEYQKELQNFIDNSLKKGDVLHFPANTILPVKIPSYVKVVYTLHDITPLLFYKGKKRNGNLLSNGCPLTTKEWEKNVKNSLERADRIVTVSKSTKDDIVSFFSIPEEKIRIIYNGINSHFVKFDNDYIEQIRKQMHIVDKKCFMAVNGGRHKNIFRVIIAYYLFLLKKERRNSFFILVGYVSKKLLLLTLPLRKSKKIICVGRISDQDLIKYYNVADFFLFFSLYEGFGFPLLEAMACGTPVICSNNSSLGELANGYADLVSAKSVLEIVKSLWNCNMISEEEKIERMIYAQSFTWDNAREKIFTLLEEL